MTEDDLKELRWLLDPHGGGEHPDRIPARLGVSKYGLAKWLRHHGHPELACKFDRREPKR